jgi:hypothetical protein
MPTKLQAPKHAIPTELQTIRFLNEHEVAALTGRAVQTLRNERFKGCGIRYVKVGRSIRYGLADVLGFMAAHTVETRGEQP